MKRSIGIDIGGTNLRVGIVDDRGNIIVDKKFATVPERGYEHSIENIVKTINDFDAEDIDTIGIGAPGPLSAKEGIILESPNLIGWHNVHIVEILEERLNRNVYLENDANVAALAEAVFGAGKEYDIVEYITLSTGVGGGLVMNKKLISGAYGIAAEIGNIILNPRGVKHSNMNKGCFESYCSGGAILKSAKDRGLNVKNAQEVFELYNNRDKAAVDTIDMFLDYLGIGISNVIHVVNPDIFVLGGGVTKSILRYDLLDKVYESVNRYQFNSVKNKVIIRPAQIEDCGIVGAAVLPWYSKQLAHI